MLLSERIAEDGITLVAHHHDGMSDDGLRCRWSITLWRTDAMNVPQTFDAPAPFESAEEPTVFDLLNHYIGVLNIIDRSADRQEWASEYTSDPEEQERHYHQRDFETWQEINEGLRGFLGGHQRHEDYLYDTDRDH